MSESRGEKKMDRRGWGLISLGLVLLVIVMLLAAGRMS